MQVPGSQVLVLSPFPERACDLAKQTSKVGDPDGSLCSLVTGSYLLDWTPGCFCFLEPPSLITGCPEAVSEPR